MTLAAVQSFTCVTFQDLEDSNKYIRMEYLAGVSRHFMSRLSILTAVVWT